MSDSDSTPEFCYRCRKGPPETKKELFECYYCSLMWHETCLTSPFNLVFEKNWMCPRHHEHLLSSRNRSQADLDLQEEITMYETADEIMKYGGVTYSVPAKSIEDEFLKYTRRFRRYSSQSAFFVDNQNSLLKPNHKEPSSEHNGGTEADGIQMLLDAAVEVENQSSEVQTPEDKKYKAIEELVNLIGEDNLLEILSK